MSVNKVFILGNLGRDPVVRFTPSGQAVANFNLATTEKWSDKSGKKQENTQWHNVVVWGSLAELCGKYLAKGRQAFVEGRLETRTWQAKDGSTKYMTEVIASSIQFIGGAPAQAKEQPYHDDGPTKASPDYVHPEFLNAQAPILDTFGTDDLPF